jgi:glycosyltransferase involved in cell wall biosynthesis
MIFNEKGILYFKDGSPVSLSQQLNLISRNPEIVKFYGDVIYNRVKDEYTWEAIYFRICTEIKKVFY